jgi:hypothetical protein
MSDTAWLPKGILLVHGLWWMLVGMMVAAMIWPLPIRLVG